MNKNNRDEEFILNSLNHYSVDESEFHNIEEVDEITKSRIKKNIKKKLHKSKKQHKGLKVALGILIVCNIFLVTVGGGGVYANIGKSVKEGMIGILAKINGDYGEYDKYSNVVNSVATDNGVEMSINEVVSDGNSVTVAYTVKCEEDFATKVGDTNFLFYSAIINGKPIDGITSIGSQENESTYSNCMVISDMKESIPKDNFDLNINVSRIGNAVGQWNFNIKVDNSKIKDKVKVYNVNSYINLGVKDSISIKKVIISPLSVAIKTTANRGDNHFILIDDKGSVMSGGGSSSNGFNVAYDFRGTENINTKYIELIPYKYNQNHSYNPKIYNVNKLPITLSNKKYGDILVDRIKWASDTSFEVNYRVSGKYTSMAAQSVWIQEGNSITGGTEEIIHQQIDNNNFKLVVKGASKNKKYSIVYNDIFARFNVFEDKAVKINLK
ncbi:MAG: DUF4179 domain-containing protein [Clostridium sp.]